MSTLADEMRSLLRDVGPLTRSEIDLFFPTQSLANIARTMNNLRMCKQPDKRARICGWVREDGIGQPYLRAVYCMGSEPDVPKPRALSQTERNKRRWAKQREETKAARVASSVWAWAQGAA